MFSVIICTLIGSETTVTGGTYTVLLLKVAFGSLLDLSQSNLLIWNEIIAYLYFERSVFVYSCYIQKSSTGVPYDHYWSILCVTYIHVIGLLYYRVGPRDKWDRTCPISRFEPFTKLLTVKKSNTTIQRMFSCNVFWWPLLMIVSRPTGIDWSDWTDWPNYTNQIDYTN